MENSSNLDFDHVKSFILDLFKKIGSWLVNDSLKDSVKLWHDAKNKLIEDVLSGAARCYEIMVSESNGKYMVKFWSFTEHVFRTAYGIAQYLIHYTNALADIIVESIIRSIDTTWGLYEAPQSIKYLRSFLSMTQKHIVVIILAMLFLVKTMTKGVKPSINIIKNFVAYALVVILIYSFWRVFFNL